MNTTPRNVHKTKSAFTLIELLTVIAIIAVLMGLLFPAVTAVKDAARKTQAKNDLVNIVNAVKAYYTEYGKYPVWPVAGTAADVKYDATNSNYLFDVLRNNNSTADPAKTLNPRGIVFIELPMAKVSSAPKGGIGSANDGKLYDPWGTPYNVAVDGNYDNQIPAATHGYSDSSFDTINTGVIAWSLGKDKQQGTNGDNKFKESDDVVSWQ